MSKRIDGTLDRSLDALRDSEERYRDLVDNSHDIIQSVSPEGRFVFVNRTWTRTFGYDAPHTLALWDIIHPDHRDHCQAVFQRLMGGESPAPIEAAFVAADGRVVLVEGIATMTRRKGEVMTHAFLHDVTERERQRQEREELLVELHQARKMDALGRLTGGVAHDFNNLLTVILGNLELMDPVDRDVRLAEEAMDAAERAAALVQRLLTFARPQALAREEVELGAVVEGMMSLLRRSLPSTITIETRLEDSGVTCHVDRSQLENVILNLAVNARDAMPNGGALVIRTWTDPDRRVWLEISDTGTGMAPDVAEHAFEPFFTTKGGNGTGLGLSSVYGFAKQSGGRATLRSALGEGTTLCIELPVYRPRGVQAL